ncbi:MAG: hypothetical protein IJ719_19575 [Clostridia bacterium]|nr:hypothetical protein [Clostridia bacterium]
MLKITLHEKDQFKNILVPESRTIRQVLVDNHIDYSAARIYVNALPIYSSGLDTKFSDMSDDTNHYIISIEPADYKDPFEFTEELFQTAQCPKAFLFGNACIIVSSLSVDEINNIKHRKPELLQLVDENGEAVFAMDIEDGFGSLKEYGAVYSNRSTSEGKATITIIFDPSEKDLVNLMQTRLSIPLQRLLDLEKKILAETRGISESEQPSTYLFCQI